MPDSTWTTASTPIQWVTGSVTYTADEKLLDAIEQVLKTAKQWKRDCGCGRNAKGKKVKDPFCEQYGCKSLDELLKPLMGFRRRRVKTSVHS